MTEQPRQAYIFHSYVYLMSDLPESIIDLKNPRVDYFNGLADVFNKLYFCGNTF